MFPPQMLDELCFVHEVVWACLWWINCFFLLKSSRYPWRQCSQNPKKKFTADAVKESAPHGSYGGPSFMNCSWTCSNYLNLFMNSSWTSSNFCWEYLNKFKFCYFFWTCSWTVHEHVREKEKTWISSTVNAHKRCIRFFSARPTGPQRRYASLSPSTCLQTPVPTHR